MKRRDGHRCRAAVAGVCGLKPQLDVHELRKRSAGGDETDPANCITVCRSCHDFIESFPAAAHELGLVKWLGDDD